MTTFHEAVELGRQWASTQATYQELTSLRMTVENITHLTKPEQLSRLPRTDPGWVALLTQLGHPVDDLEFGRGFASGILGSYNHALQRHLEDQQREAQAKPIRDEVRRILDNELEALVLSILHKHGV